LVRDVAIASAFREEIRDINSFLVGSNWNCERFRRSDRTPLQSAKRR
jgi:hypothetical protein